MSSVWVSDLIALGPPEEEIAARSRMRTLRTHQLLMSYPEKENGPIQCPSPLPGHCTIRAYYENGREPQGRNLCGLSGQLRTKTVHKMSQKQEDLTTISPGTSRLRTLLAFQSSQAEVMLLETGAPGTCAPSTGGGACLQMSALYANRKAVPQATVPPDLRLRSEGTT